MFFESYFSFLQHHTSDTQLVKIHYVRKILVSFISPQNFTFSLRYSASCGPLRPFGFASLRQPDDATACAPYGARPVASGNLTTSSQVHLVAGASRLCVKNKNLPKIIESTCSNFQNLRLVLDTTQKKNPNNILRVKIDCATIRGVLGKQGMNNRFEFTRFYYYFGFSGRSGFACA